MSIHWHHYSTPDLAAEACARNVIARIENALGGEGSATLALSGGTTPGLMFDRFVEAQIDWDRVHLFWVDERCVPPYDPESNYRLAEERFIQPLRFPHRNVHRIHGELRPDQAARRYVDEIRDFFNLAPGELPAFDVIHRGMGADAHTASLFPGEPLLNDRESVASAVYVEKLGKYRVTLLPGVLLNARHTVLLVCGADKADSVWDVFNQPYDPLKYPAQIVAHHGRHITWFLDEAAASRVRQAT